VDTNNGTKAQNKLLKYGYLPKHKKLSLSCVVTLLVQEFLPDMNRKYLFENFKITSNYRQYKSFVPDYLHDRPRSVIKHCLERKAKSQKYVEDDTRCISDTEGIFEVKGTDKIHRVKFGSKEEEPSFTCKDWLKWKIPCKHFFWNFSILQCMGLVKPA